MEKIQYDQQEAALVYQAQQMMVSLQQAEDNIKNLEIQRLFFRVSMNLPGLRLPQAWRPR